MVDAVAPDDPAGPHAEEDVAASITRLFEEAVAKPEMAPEQSVPIRPDGARLMLEAVHRALDRMMTALTVVNLREWRERRGR